jgi:hypothetical protein
MEGAWLRTQLISTLGWSKLEFAERDKCKPVLKRLSLAGNLEKTIMSLYRGRMGGARLCALDVRTVGGKFLKFICMSQRQLVFHIVSRGGVLKKLSLAGLAKLSRLRYS